MPPLASPLLLVQALEQEGPDLHVLQGVGILALIYLVLHGVLVFEHRVERLGVHGRQLRVAPDQGNEHVRVRTPVELANGAGAERVRGDVDQHGRHVVSHFDTGLDAGSERHAQIRVHFPMRLLSQTLGEELRDARNARRSADQQHAIEIARADRSVVERGGHRLHGAAQQLLDRALEVGATQLPGEMLRRAVHRGHVVFFDERVRLTGQLDLGPLRRPSQAGLQQAVPAGVAKPHPGFQVTVQAIQDDRVEVVAAQVVVAAGREHLDDPAFDRHHGDVERAAAQVVDQHPALPFVAGVVRQRCRAVGSLMIRTTSRPAICPASRVACR